MLSKQLKCQPPQLLWVKKIQAIWTFWVFIMLALKTAKEPLFFGSKQMCLACHLNFFCMAWHIFQLLRNVEKVSNQIGEEQNELIFFSMTEFNSSNIL